MKRIFVFEYLTGGGLVAGDASAVQTLLPLGVRMRDAMVGDLLDAGCFAVTAGTSARAPHLRAGAAACRAPAGTSLFDLVAQQAALHDAVWLVAPETDGLLARFQQCVPADRWLGCEPAAIALASSKRATLSRLAAVGVATPLAFATTASRWVVKPDDGAGAVATTVHTSRAAALAAQKASGGAMTLEPWVEGEPLSLSLLCGPGGSEVLSVNRQHIEIAPDGRLAYCGVAYDSRVRSPSARHALARLAADVHGAVGGLRGFVGIDLVWHAERGPVLIEINPRITCAYAGLSARLRRNLAADMLAPWLAQPSLETRHARA